MAAAIGVSRANLTQWETGKYLPSPQNAHALDDYFGAGGLVSTLVESGRPPVAAAPVPGTPGGPSLLEVFHRVGTSLRDAISRGPCASEDPARTASACPPRAMSATAPSPNSPDATMSAGVMADVGQFSEHSSTASRAAVCPGQPSR